MMAGFGAGKNPPWAREAGLSQAGIAQSQVALGQPGVSTVYSLSSQPTMSAAQQYAIQAQAAAVQQAVQMPQPGIAIPTTLATTQVATVSYPAPRAAGPPPGGPPKQRVFTGSVTKLHDNFGFVDEDVFFQTNCVKGVLPKVGDRVLVEASYNSNMPFKWNANRIQVLPNQSLAQAQAGMNHNQPNMGGFTQHQPPIVSVSYKPPGGMAPPPQLAPNIAPPPLAPPPLQHAPPLMGPGPGRQGGAGPFQQHQPPPLQQHQPHQQQHQQQQQQQQQQQHQQQQQQHGPGPQRALPVGSRKPELPSYGRDRDRDRGRDRERHHDRRERRSPRRRSKSPRRSRSPSIRARSPARRPKSSRNIVPRYTVQIPKISLDVTEANVVALRSRYPNLYVPSDFFNAGFRWCEAFPPHRPFGLGNPCNFYIMHKEVEPLDKPDASLEPPDADHLYSAKVMLLSSGAIEEIYQKSCALAEDSSEAKENFQHPTRLLQFLVGLKGKSEPMAIGGPWSPSQDGANPADDPRVLINTAIRTTRALTGVDLSICTQWYRFAEIRYHRPEESHKGRLVPARVETVVIFLPDVWSSSPTRLEWESLQGAYKKQLNDKLTEETKDDAQDEEEEGVDGGSPEKTDPTHFSELDPKNMKVADLRRELECRNLSSKGLKSQLIARLTKAIKSEQETEAIEAEKKDEEEEMFNEIFQQEEQKPEEAEKTEVDLKEEENKKKEEEEKRKRDERDKAQRERRYILPENPAIVVHPSPTAKGGKFDCTVMSLSLLLDYRPEDNKEHSFEVSLFAELFNEMLMRDCGFNIYRCLATAPDRKEEEKKAAREEKEKSKEKDEKKPEKEEKTESEEKVENAEGKDAGTEEPASKKRKLSAEEEEKEKVNHVDKKDSKEDKKDTKEATDKKSEKESKEKEKEEEPKEKEEPSAGDRERRKSSRDKEREKDRDRDRDRERERDRDKDKKREKQKFFTSDPALLLAFVYFDQSHTGYLLDKDVEEIIHTLGLHLSRAQVKKMVQKLVSRDTLNYRKLTDKPSEEKKETKEEEAEKDGEESMETESKSEGKDAKGSDLDLELLGKGNKPLLVPPKVEPQAETPTKTRTRKESAKSASGDASPGAAASTSTGMLLYKGAMLDVNSVMLRLERSEKSRTALETKLKDHQEEMDSLKESFSASEKNGQKVTLEVQDLKKKLRDQRKATDQAEGFVKKYGDVLGRSKSVLGGLLTDVKDVLEVGAKDSTSSPKKDEEIKKEIKKEVNGD